ncbi:hypothetical protein Tco_1095622 [Tanacetum coccineum]
MSKLKNVLGTEVDQMKTLGKERRRSDPHGLEGYLKMVVEMLKITISNTSSRNKLNPEINDHYNILTGECQIDELKTKDKALYVVPTGRVIATVGM